MPGLQHCRNSPFPLGISVASQLFLPTSSTDMTDTCSKVLFSDWTRFHPTPWLNIRSTPWHQAMLPLTSHIRRRTYPHGTALTVAALASLSSWRLQRLQLARLRLPTSSHRSRSHEVGRGRLHSQG